jgi:L,D-peptidoglycan transpeptidase YkuD (ErfK/YbiS/YcfS/YnhG family)
MTRVLLALAVLAAVLVPTSPARAATVRLDGVPVRLEPGTGQVVTVNHTHGHHARVTLWRLHDGRWEQRLRAHDGRIGYGGLVLGDRRRQGTGTTPLGTYSLPWAFGTHAADERWDLDYRPVRRGDFWVQDNQSLYYNRYRNQGEGGFRWWLPTSDPNSSERLTDFRREYEWSIVVGFNTEQVRYRGAGIFLHVNGAGATAGCVSAPRAFVRTLMRRLDPDLHPLIAIGR